MTQSPPVHSRFRFWRRVAGMLAWFTTPDFPLRGVVMMFIARSTTLRRIYHRQNRPLQRSRALSAAQRAAIRTSLFGAERTPARFLLPAGAFAAAAVVLLVAVPRGSGERTDALDLRPRGDADTSTLAVFIRCIGPGGPPVVRDEVLVSDAQGVGGALTCEQTDTLTYTVTNRSAHPNRFEATLNGNGVDGTLIASTVAPHQAGLLLPAGTPLAEVAAGEYTLGVNWGDVTASVVVVIRRPAP